MWSKKLKMLHRIRYFYFILIFIFCIQLGSMTTHIVINVNKKSDKIDTKPFESIRNSNGAKIKVAVIDTGISSIFENNIYHNPKELNGTNGVDDDNNSYIDDMRGWNAYSDNNNTYDWSTSEHGTAVASMVLKDNPNVELIPIVFIDSNNVIEDYNQLLKLVDALNYAETVDANVVVMAFNYFISTPTIIANKFTELKNNGIILLASAGNCDGTSASCNYIKEPAIDSSVWAIGSIGPDNLHSSFSSSGPELDFVTYGESVQVTTDVGVSLANGTSFSVGYFASIVSRFLSANNNLTPTQAFNYLKNTVQYLGDHNEYGYGMPVLSYAIISVTDNIAPVLNDYTTELIDANTYRIQLNIHEENALSYCYYSLTNTNISNELVVDNSTCVSSHLPILSQSGIITYTISVHPYPQFQVDIVLIDSNMNRNALSFDLSANVTGIINSSQGTSWSSYTQPNTSGGYSGGNSQYLSQGNVISQIYTDMSSNTVSKNMSTMSLLSIIIIMPVLTYIRRKKSE